MVSRALLAVVAAFLLSIPGAGALAQEGTPMEVQVVTLKPVRGSMASGWAWIVPYGEQVIVTTLVMGLEPGSTHSNHLHSGSCETPGRIVYPLVDLNANAEGTATATSLVPASMGMVAMGHHYYAHAGILGTSPEAATPIICGNIVEMMMPGM